MLTLFYSHVLGTLVLLKECVCVARGSPDSQQRVWLPQWFKLAYSIYITAVCTTPHTHKHTFFLFVVAQSLDTQDGAHGQKLLSLKAKSGPLGCTKSIMAVNVGLLEFHLASMWLPKPLNSVIYQLHWTSLTFIQWSGRIIGICLARSLSLIGREQERAPLIISSTWIHPFIILVNSRNARVVVLVESSLPVSLQYYCVCLDTLRGTRHNWIVTSGSVELGEKRQRIAKLRTDDVGKSILFKGPVYEI